MEKPAALDELIQSLRCLPGVGPKVVLPLLVKLWQWHNLTSGQGDAAGLVSPVTAGGIHTALVHGLAAGHAVAEFLSGRSVDPQRAFVRSYPRFRFKRLLRFAFDHLQRDWIFDLALASAPMRWAACRVYFHKRASPTEAGTPAGAVKRPVL